MSSAARRLLGRLDIIGPITEGRVLINPTRGSDQAGLMSDVRYGGTRIHPCVLGGSVPFLVLGKRLTQ
jgi:hypothetical protein